MKIPKLKDVHILFHHTLPKIKNKWKNVDCSYGSTICQIIKDGKSISEGKSVCNIDDNFSRPYGRALSLQRALKTDSLSIEEKSEIFSFVSDMPSSRRFFYGRRKLFVAEIHNRKYFRIHIAIPVKIVKQKTKPTVLDLIKALPTEEDIKAEAIDYSICNNEDSINIFIAGAKYILNKLNKE